MKIIRLSLWHVPLTSHATYHMAAGKSCDTVETVVVRLDTDAGVNGWGEVCPIPHYLPAYARGVGPALTEMAPVILGADPVGPEAVMAKADAWLSAVNTPRSIALLSKFRMIAVTAKTAKAAPRLANRIFHTIPKFIVFPNACSEIPRSNRNAEMGVRLSC